MNTKFESGDRVRYEGEHLLYEYMRGEEGVVLDENDIGIVFVRWDLYSEERHNCAGRCKTGHGWQVLNTELVLLSGVEDCAANVCLEEVL